MQAKALPLILAAFLVVGFAAVFASAEEATPEALAASPTVKKRPDDIGLRISSTLSKRKELVQARKADIQAKQAELKQAREDYAQAVKDYSATRARLAVRRSFLTPGEKEEFRKGVSKQVISRVKQTQAVILLMTGTGLISGGLKTSLETLANETENEWKAATTIEEKKKIIKEFNQDMATLRKQANKEIKQKLVDGLLAKYAKLIEKIKARTLELEADAKKTAKLNEMISVIEADAKELREGVLEPSQAAFRLRHLNWGVRKWLLLHAQLTGKASADQIPPEEPSPVAQLPEPESQEIPLPEPSPEAGN